MAFIETLPCQGKVAALARDTALLIIDMLNTFDFEGGDRLAEAARRLVGPINHLRSQARAAGCPAIYVNDNYGRWHDERSDLLAFLMREGGHGADIAQALAMADDDYFVIKPEASGFYATSLPALLPRLGVSRLVLTGVAADICVQFTAADAHMREYPLWIPADAVAGITRDRTEWALEVMADSMSADTRATIERGFLDSPQDEDERTPILCCTLSPGGAHGWRSTMPRGDKSSYTDKQKRKAEHIEEGY